MLAGAYRGRDIGERSLLTHAVLVEGVRPGNDIRVLCSLPLESVADTYSDPDGIYEAPTCPTCLPRWERLQERYLEDMHREPDMERNPRRPRAAPLLEGETSTGRIRGTSGRFQSSTACDFCGKSCAAEHFTDDRASRGGDGPGFYLCGRAACERARERLESEQGFEALLDHYAEQRRINDAQGARQEAVYTPPAPKRSSAELSKLMGSREGALLLAEEKGHSMAPWEGGRSECTRCGASMTFEPGFGASGSAIQRGSKCEMRSNGELPVFGACDDCRDVWRRRQSVRKKDAAEMLRYKRRRGICGSCGDVACGLVTVDPATKEILSETGEPLWKELPQCGLTPNSERRYYVWVILSDGTPKDEGPYGPYEFIEAKDSARIGATEGAHDRAVSVGRDPQTESFHIARQYRRGTGERVL